MKTLSLIFILFSQLSTITSYHVVFEQIGELASSVTYIHVKLTIDFDSIEKHIFEYQGKLTSFKAQLSSPRNYEMPENVREAIKENSAYQLQRQIVARHIDAAQRIISNKLITTSHLISDVNQLKNSMPIPADQDRLFVPADQPSQENSTIVEQETDSKPASKLKMNLKFIKNPVLKDVLANRNARFINPIGLALGAFGTFMGLYNTKQIANLRQEIAQKQSVMIDMIQDNSKKIYDMSASMTVLKTFMASSHLYDLSVFISEITDVENEIRTRIQWAAHAIQAAQYHRLSIDFLTDIQLMALFKKLNKQSGLAGQQLLTEKPSDLYQLETSYFFDGVNVHILLHVPMITKGSQLRLLKLHPFPLPLNENYTITPEVNDDILAISSGWDRLSAKLSAIDLLSCHSVNKIYLCDRQGVLSKELNNSCLGALYLQDFAIAKELCDFKIKPTQEVVQQLLDNWFLIYSVKVQTAFISCTNGTQQENYLKSGISKIHLSPGCQANLAEHRLIADGAIVLPSDITHFEWTWNAAAELELNPITLSEYIDELQKAGINDPSLEDLSHLKIKKSSKIDYLIYFISFIFSCIALGSICLVIFFFVTKKIVLDYKKLLPCLFPIPPLIEPIIQETNQTLYPLLNRPPANAPLYNLN
jgi:hypothetical protein